MSATVQPGSSGGPIFDHNGLLVGIVRARLLPSGPIAAQNVNFGINLPTLSNFLDAHSVDYAVNAVAGKAVGLADITALAQKSTVQVECY
jgi:S1-C subfamily serine protease